MSYGTLGAGARLHYQILHSVMRLPMHFFDTNPVGRMINRFGKDMDTLDTVLPMTLRSWTVCFFTVCAEDFSPCTMVWSLIVCLASDLQPSQPPLSSVTKVVKGFAA